MLTRMVFLSIRSPGRPVRTDDLLNHRQTYAPCEALCAAAPCGFESYLGFVYGYYCLVAISSPILSHALCQINLARTSWLLGCVRKDFLRVRQSRGRVRKWCDSVGNIGLHIVMYELSFVFITRVRNFTSIEYSRAAARGCPQCA